MLENPKYTSTLDALFTKVDMKCRQMVRFSKLHKARNQGHHFISLISLYSIFIDIYQWLTNNIMKKWHAQENPVLSSLYWKVFWDRLTALGKHSTSLISGWRPRLWEAIRCWCAVSVYMLACLIFLENWFSENNWSTENLTVFCKFNRSGNLDTENLTQFCKFNHSGN